MATDRAIVKERQAGQAEAYGLAAQATKNVVADMHRRVLQVTKSGTENAATAVSETAAGVVPRKSRVVSIKWLGGTVANDATDYVKITAYKRTSAGASQTALGSWNSATAAQGAITAQAPASLSLVSNSDIEIDAGSSLTYAITKAGAGKDVGVGLLAFDLEEI